MKILHIIDSNGRGGAELMLNDFIKATSEEFEHTVFSLVEAKHEGVRSDYFGAGVSTIKNVRETFRILRRVKRQKQVDIVHTHLPLSGLIGRWVFRKAKLIIHVHNELSKTDFGKHWLFSRVEKLFPKSPYTFAFVSKTCLLDYQKNFGQVQHAKVIHNAVNQNYYHQALDLIERPSKLKFVSVGNWKAQKGFDFLIQVFAELPDKELTIYCDLNAAQVQARFSIDIPKTVTIISGKELTPEEYSKFDVFVSSSRYEGFGNVVVEAGLSGLELLLPNLAVFQELFADEANFYDAENKLSLKTAVQNLPDNFASEGVASKFAYQFSSEKRINQTKELYQSLLG